MIVSNKVETVRKEAVVYKFEVPSRKLNRETEWSRGRYQADIRTGHLPYTSKKALQL